MNNLRNRVGRIAMSRDRRILVTARNVLKVKVLPFVLGLIPGSPGSGWPGCGVPWLRHEEKRERG